jgi:hypothetical protein
VSTSQRPLSGGAKGGIVALVLAVLAGIAWFVPPINHKISDLLGLNDEPVISDFDPEHRVQSGRVTLGLPDDMTAANTPVTFTDSPKDKAAANGAMYGISALGNPVDIHATNKDAKLPDNKVLVSFSYDPATLPKGVSPANLGIALYDERLATWVPLLNAKVDEKARTVSAVSPHFSKLVDIFLDPAKQAINIPGVGAIKTYIDAQMTVVKWYANFIKEVATDLFKKLAAIAPDLKCKRGTRTMKVTKTTGVADRLKGCIDDTDGSDKQLNLRNGYGWPLRSEKLPAGINMNFDDVLETGNDTVGLFRGAYWASRGHAIIEPAELGRVSIHKDMKQSAIITYNLDSDAVGVDIVVAVLTVLGGVKAFERGAVKGVLKPLVQKGSSAFKEAVAAGGATAAWTGVLMSQIDCVHGAIDNESPKEVANRKSYELAAEVASKCLSLAFETLNIQTAVGGVLDSLKILPELLQTTLAATVQGVSGGRINTMTSSISVARVDSSSESMKQFVGTWKNTDGFAPGQTTITIKSDKSATMKWIQAECDGECVGGGTFIIWGTATLSGVVSGNKLTLTYRSVRYESTRDGVISEGDAGVEAPVAGSSREILTLKSGTITRKPVREGVDVNDGYFFDLKFRKQ